MGEEAAINSVPVLRVRRKEAELVVPAKACPREVKALSDLDNRLSLRRDVWVVMMYRNNPSMKGKDPVEVIREATAQALVFYYPLAGRLQQGPDLKLSVDCSNEGISFVEADADFGLEEFGELLQPPFPYLDELVFDSSGALHCPLVLIQVTRLKCGGFIFALGINHVMVDAHGNGQFISAISEMARGALSPSTPPCWSREFFSARDPPRGMRHNYIHDTVMKPLEDDDLVEKSLHFTRSHVSALRMLAPQNLRHLCSSFDLLTACLWRTRTIALQLCPEDQVYLTFTVNARGRDFNPPVPRGYYGNAAVTTVVSSNVGSLCNEPFGYALQLVRKAKADVTEEYIRSFVDQIAIMKGGNPLPALPAGRCFFVTDMRYVNSADFGWGTAAYAGPYSPTPPPTQGLPTPYLTCNGGDEILAFLRLPRVAMKIFETQLRAMSLHGCIHSDP